MCHYAVNTQAKQCRENFGMLQTSDEKEGWGAARSSGLNVTPNRRNHFKSTLFKHEFILRGRTHRELCLNGGRKRLV